MENASKALLIAGGVLIAIIIVSLLVRTYGSIGRFQKQQLSIEETERIEKFNKEYTKYQGQYVYGTEVITVINKSANDSTTSTVDVFVDNKKVDSTYINSIENLKSKPFYCEKIGYGTDGKVNEIRFITKSVTE